MRALVSPQLSDGLGPRRWKEPLDRALHLLLPPACAGCGRPLRREDNRVCPGCLSRLREPAHPRCSRCEAPRGTGLPPSRPCPECEEWPEALVRARCGALFAPPADALVHALKFGGWGELAPLMATRLTLAARRVSLPPSTIVVPVPTTSSRRRERGYNQAELLARALGEIVDLPVVDALRRSEARATQISLPRAERLANVDGAFRVVPERASVLDGRTILLVDDVLTTGATASAAATELSRSGAAEISLVAFARSLPEEEG